MNFIRLVRKKNIFLESEKLFFLQSRASQVSWEQRGEKTIEPEKLFFCKARLVWIFIRLVRKKNRSLKNWFSAEPQFSSNYWGKQCFRSPSLPTYWFWVDWKQSKHARKKQFFGAWKIVFCKASVFFKLLRKTMFQVPKPTHILILGGLEAVQACAKKAIFRSLKNCFSAKPPFSSSYWGKQCFRSPSLPTYVFWVDWKQCKHARKTKIGTWTIAFCKIQLHPVRQYKGSRQKMNRKGESQTSRISSNLRIWQSYSRVPQILKILCVWYTWKYVARLGFEPLKFLYSEFLYNTQAVFSVLVVHDS